MNAVKTLFTLAFSLLCLAGFGATNPPVEIIPPDLRGAIQPQIAVTPKGTIYVAFGKDTSIYCTASKDDGETFIKPVKVAELPKLALGMRRGPRISASDKQVVISAISHSEGNLYAWVSSDQGASWSKRVKVNDVDTSAREGMHAMADDGQGNVHAAWLDLRNKKTELWSARSADGGKTWSTNTLIYKSPDHHICECCSPSLAVGNDGKVWAMWRNWLEGKRDMHLAASTDGGTTFAAGKKLGEGNWYLKACPMDGGNLAIQPDGSPITVWRREGSIFAAGASGPERAVSLQGMQPVVAVAGTNTFYLWQKASRLLVQKSGRPMRVLAEGAFPSLAAVPGQDRVFAVWEASTNDTKTILATRLE